jgi:hypothetical protein
MQIRHHPATAAAILLGSMAVLHALLGGSGGASLLHPAERPLPSPATPAGKTLEWCRGNVSIIHDVYWASACSVVAEEQRKATPAPNEAPDGSPDCTLPDDRARSLNLARAKADQQCVEEAAAMAQRDPGSR